MGAGKGQVCPGNSCSRDLGLPLESLGVEPQWVDTLVELGLIFKNDHLEVDACQESNVCLFETLTGALLHLGRFTKFSDSRWCTVGTACRTLCLGILTGFESLVATILADPKISKFYLGGFGRLNSKIKRFVAIAALCSWPSDSVLF